MKTITEFSGFALKEAISKKAALLTEGKTEEEALSAIHEMLKLDETKAPFYKNAVDMTSSRIDRVKRVVIATKANDAEKVPESFMEREGHFYLIEYFPEANTRGAKKEESASYHDDFVRGRSGGGRGGPRGNDRGNGRGNDRGNDRGSDRGNDRGRGRRPGGDAPRFGDANPRPVFPDGQRPAGPRPDRGPRPPRDTNREARPPRGPAGPRGPAAPRGPKGAGELRLVLKGQSSTTLQGSGPATPVAEASVAAPSTEN
jgi:hypothetical protein